METIPARRGKATYLRHGQSIRIVNTHGAQVVDTWAFTAGMLTEFMSMEHTRATLTRLVPKVGDGLYTNRRRKILTMTKDTSRGDHVVLRAELDCVVAMSACPQDILPINGKTGKTTEAHYEILDTP